MQVPPWSWAMFSQRQDPCGSVLLFHFHGSSLYIESTLAESFPRISRLEFGV